MDYDMIQFRKKLNTFPKYKNSSMWFSFQMEIKALQKPMFEYNHMFVTSLYKKSTACLYLHYSP